MCNHYRMCIAAGKAIVSRDVAMLIYSVVLRERVDADPHPADTTARASPAVAIIVRPPTSAGAGMPSPAIVLANPRSPADDAPVFRAAPAGAAPAAVVPAAASVSSLHTTGDQTTGDLDTPGGTRAKCPVCLDGSEDSEEKPFVVTLTGCGHVVCFECALGLRRAAPAGELCRCPVCRAEVPHFLKLFIGA